MSMERFARSNPVPPQEFGNGQAAARRTLEFEDAQGAVAGCNRQFIGEAFQDRSRRCGDVHGRYLRPKDLEPLTLQEREGAGPGCHAPDEGLDACGRLFPVDLAVGFFQKGRIGRTLVLDAPGGRCCGEGLQGVDEQAGTQLRQAVMQGPGRVIPRDGLRGGHQDVAGVEALVDHHGGDAGLFFVVDHRPVDGGGPAVFGQQGGMHVDAAQSRYFQNGFPQQMTEGDNNKKVSLGIF